ncbi:hypothetical protein COBT_000019 [Conglomerata obtusa]
MHIFLISFINCFRRSDATALVQSGLEKLHKSTKYATFYDLFNVKINASLPQIQSQYKKFLKNKSKIEGMTPDESMTFYTDVYNILSKYKDSYDYLLKYQSYPTEGYAWYYWILVFVICVFTGDFVLLLWRWRRLQRMDRKARKKVERKGGVIRGIQFSELYTSRFFMCIKNKIIG